MADEPGSRYSRTFLGAMVYGEYEDRFGQRHDAEDITWSRLRARLERTGNLESGAVSLVLDLERALLALYREHPEGAICVMAQMVFEPAEGPKDLRELFGPRSNPERWISKAIAWCTAYLNGLPIRAPKGSPSCEAAWRGAR